MSQLRIWKRKIRKAKLLLYFDKKFGAVDKRKGRFSLVATLNLRHLFGKKKRPGINSNYQKNKHGAVLRSENKIGFMNGLSLKLFGGPVNADQKK